jgi:hypothetical protein
MAWVLQNQFQIIPLHNSTIAHSNERVHPVASSYGISEGNRLMWDRKEGLAFCNSFIQQRFLF